MLLFKKDKKHFIFYLFIFFMQLWTLVSNAYIETGIYITEQDRYSYSNNSTKMLFLYNIIFFLGIYFVNKVRWNNTSFVHGKELERNGEVGNLSKRILLLLLTCMIVISCSLAINSLLTKFTYGDAINKFNFWEHSIFPFLLVFHKQMYLIAIISGIIFTVFKNKKKIRLLSVVNVVALVINLIVQGHKFTTIAILMISFYIPIYVRGDTINRIKVSKKLIMQLFIPLMGLALFILLSINEYSKDLGSARAAWDQIVYRSLGLQGHVWWGIYDLTTSSLFTIDYYQNFIQEITEIVNPTAEHLTAGMRELMITLSPSRAYRFIQDSVNFTMGYPAIIIYSFGLYLGMIIQFVFGCVYGKLIKNFEKTIQHNSILLNIIPIAIYSKIFFSSFDSFIMGNMYEFFSLKNLMLIIILMMYRIIVRVIRV
ncbi:oligosaccharide repeat unit polymerase [Bacillus cereus]|uniref:Oligosaccharide repeat unit polymerase n=2 Tax=Bacillus cereus TaxID=1396 RepID=A0A2B9DXX2_BACCE|nr:oligosaccharide repeat unit polymerase [Bacillus cereus]